MDTAEEGLKGQKAGNSKASGKRSRHRDSTSPFEEEAKRSKNLLIGKVKIDGSGPYEVSPWYPELRADDEDLAFGDGLIGNTQMENGAPLDVTPWYPSLDSNDKIDELPEPLTDADYDSGLVQEKDEEEEEDTAIIDRNDTPKISKRFQTYSSPVGPKNEKVLFREPLPPKDTRHIIRHNRSGADGGGSDSFRPDYRRDKSFHPSDAGGRRGNRGSDERGGWNGGRSWNTRQQPSSNYNPSPNYDQQYKGNGGGREQGSYRRSDFGRHGERLAGRTGDNGGGSGGRVSRFKGSDDHGGDGGRDDGFGHGSYLISNTGTGDNSFSQQSSSSANNNNDNSFASPYEDYGSRYRCKSDQVCRKYDGPDKLDPSYYV